MYDIFVVEIRGFVGSDLDASVIASASARRGSHGETVMRFLKNRTIHLFPTKIKQAEQGSTCFILVEIRGFEPLTFALRTRRSTN